MLLFQTGPFQPGPLEQEDQVWNPAVLVAPVSLEKVGLKLSWCGTGLGDFGCDQHEIIRHEVHMRAGCERLLEHFYSEQSIHTISRTQVAILKSVTYFIWLILQH